MDTILKQQTHRPLLNLEDKINLNRSGKQDALSNVSMYYTWKSKKSHIKTITIKPRMKRNISIA